MDYTYVHPEVLAERCTVEGQKLILNNKENREEYSVLIVPGGDTLSVAAAAKIERVLRKGRMVIADQSLCPGVGQSSATTSECQKMVADVFGLPVNDPPTADLQRAMGGRLVTFYFSKRNAAGGRAYFLPKAEPWVLRWALGQVLPVRDVNIQEPIPLLKKGPDYDGALTYIHKVKNGHDIYFFANSTDKPVDTKVVLRGRKALRIWNPHTGDSQPANVTAGEASGQPVTTVHLVLPAYFLHAAGAECFNRCVGCGAAGAVEIVHPPSAWRRRSARTRLRPNPSYADKAHSGRRWRRWLHPPPSLRLSEFRRRLRMRARADMQPCREGRAWAGGR